MNYAKLLQLKRHGPGKNLILFLSDMFKAWQRGF